ncbi:MAG: RNA 3'-terminal phosphate cyclase [Candidatus Ranarchaeia archaeon]
MITIDGAMGEAGGQILRTAMAIAAVRQRPIKIINIRAKRHPPGLKQQHLEAVKAITNMTRGETQGMYLGSETIVYFPGALRGGDFSIPIKTAGAISLVIQAILPVMAFSTKTSTVTITGGTDVKWAPPIDYVRYIFLYYLSGLGLDNSFRVICRGYYPKGGGKVFLKVKAPTDLKPFHLTSTGQLRKISGISHCRRLPAHVAKRQAEAAEKELIKAGLGDVDIKINIETSNSDSYTSIGPGSGITLWAEYNSGARVAGDALGSKGVPAEKVGVEAAKQLIKELRANAPIDSHMADMLIPWAAIIGNHSIFRTRALSSHSRTGIALVKKLTNREITITEEAGSVIVESY